jgi:hypothetical protein
VDSHLIELLTEPLILDALSLVDGEVLIKVCQSALVDFGETLWMPMMFLEECSLGSARLPSFQLLGEVTNDIGIARRRANGFPEGLRLRINLPLKGRLLATGDVGKVPSDLLPQKIISKLSSVECVIAYLMECWGIEGVPTGKFRIASGQWKPIDVLHGEGRLRHAMNFGVEDPIVALAQ